MLSVQPPRRSGRDAGRAMAEVFAAVGKAVNLCSEVQSTFSEG